MVFMMFCVCVCMIHMVWTYCDPWKNFCVMRVFCVECLMGSGMHLSFCGKICCGVWVGDRTWNDSLVSYFHCYCCCYDC